MKQSDLWTKLLTVLSACILAGGVTAKSASENPTSPNALRALAPHRDDSAAARMTHSQPPRRIEAQHAATPAGSGKDGRSQSAQRNVRKREEMDLLKEQLARQGVLLAEQQERIARLEVAFEELSKRAPRPLVASYEPSTGTRPAQVASSPVGHPDAADADDAVHPVVRVPMAATISHPAQSTSSATPASLTPDGGSSSVSTQPAQGETQSYTTRLDTLSKQVEGISRGIAGFRFSGDLRLRSDGIFRSSNSLSGPVQNVRGRYRARLNLDKGVDRCLDVHFQLGSGRFDNALSDDTDFGGGAVHGPIFLTEAWADYHPNSTLSLRGGKMPEVFQDYSRFLWDEDVRFNGFQESVGTSPEDTPLGITRVDIRAGQYVLTNPNIQVLPTAAQCSAANPPASCAYLKAGYQPGENVRTSDLFDQGIFVKGRIKPGWSHYFYTNLALYRNPNQIALTSLSSGFPLLINSELGLTVAGPLTGTGTATTTPGGGIFTAGHFQIGHLAYRITKDGWKFRREDFPVFLDFQASRNFGTSFLRNAWMATVNAGEIKKAGDVRFLYFYAVKEGNSMISQFTDDHVGTLTGVNVRTHAIRFDVGLARFLQWQNIFYIQNGLNPNDPARHFYVPVPAGTPTQYRAESSLFINF
jgi:Putative porin